MPIGGIGAFCVGFITLALCGFPSQLCFNLGSAAYGAVWKVGHRHSRVPAWLAAGTVTRDVAVLAAVSLVTSGIALVPWFLSVRPNIDDIVRTFVPNWPLAALILGGLLFSMINAALEEVAHRGIVMSPLESTNRECSRCARSRSQCRRCPRMGGPVCGRWCPDASPYAGTCGPGGNRILVKGIHRHVSFGARTLGG